VILSYNIFINFTEVLWKSQLKELFPNPEEYTAYFSSITFYIGVFATLGSYLISGNVLRKFGWRFTAYITPIIMMITGIGFFYFLFLKEYSTTSALIFGMTPLALTVLFGSLQNVLSRAAKYTVFDNTKEMVFIPLSSDEKLKAKSAIDGIGSRLGKSGSSLTLQVLLMFFSTILATAPVILAIMILVFPVWILSINSLGKKFQEYTGSESEPETETEPKAETT
jgi:AAA family ATP:ADP antiporter